MFIANVNGASFLKLYYWECVQLFCVIGDTAYITAVANDIVTSKVKGYPELDLSISDPLIIAEINIEQGIGRFISMKIRFSSIIGLPKCSDKDRVVD